MTTMIRTIAAAAALGCAAITAVPAAANEKLPTPAYKMTYDAKANKFCLRGADTEVQTGTRIRVIECKTQNEWAAEGLKVAKK